MSSSTSAKGLRTEDIKTRRVYICDVVQNEPSKFCSNRIKTSKYTALNFIFKNLWVQFHRLANVYFVFAGIFRVRPTVLLYNDKMSLTWLSNPNMISMKKNKTAQICGKGICAMAAG